jgi:hypothetical protein
MNDIQRQTGQVIFTADDWPNDPASKTFGVTKLVPKAKEPTPGMKAILVTDESFRRAKKQMKAYPAFRSQLDLPGLISAMIDVCDADPVVMESVVRRIVDERRRQLELMMVSMTPSA